MSDKNPTLKNVLHNANKALSNSDRDNLTNTNSSEITNKSAERTRKRIEDRQVAIDLYNTVTCVKLDPFFENFQLGGKNIIVRLHKENYIKAVTEYADNVPLYDAWISQVDGRMRQTDRENWIDNPLPYVFTGVIVAMSPAVKVDFDKEASEVGYGYKKLAVGDIVHLEHFMYADKRFYINKQQRDFLKNPQDYRIEHWEGYVKIHPSMIEGILLDKTEFLKETSAYEQYKLNK